MKSRPRRKRGSKGQQTAQMVLNEAFALMRRTPPLTFLAYYVGSAPFVVFLLFFIADMSQNAFAVERCSREAGMAALLFVWMKGWHAVYSALLLRKRSAVAAEAATVRCFFRALPAQALIHSTGLIALTIAVLSLVIPPIGLFVFPFVYTFYQNVTARAFHGNSSVREVWADAWRKTGYWPRQTLFTCWTILLLALFAVLNVGYAAVIVPYMMRSLFGVETIFTISGLAAVQNTTFISTIIAVSFLCLDPLVKATFTLRCFYVDCLKTGEDLRADLRIVRGRTVVGAALACVALAFLVVEPAAAQPRPKQARLWAQNLSERSLAQPTGSGAPSVHEQELNHAIDDVLSSPDYGWRLPRVELEPETFLTAFLQDIANLFESIWERGRAWWDRIREWWNDLFGREQQGSRGWTMPAGGMTGLWVVFGIGVIILAAVLVTMMRRMKKTNVQPLEPVAAVKPDVADENVSADQLPEDEWLSLGNELLQKGRLRLAMRAYFLGVLAYLAHCDLISLSSSKSNSDYERELRLRAHALPKLMPAFDRNIQRFECVWYGRHHVDQELLNRFLEDFKQMREQE